MTRAIPVLLCWALVGVVSGCGGNDENPSVKPTPPPQAPLQAKEPVGGPIGRAALRAARVVDPRECPRWYEKGQGVSICEDYVTAGSRQAHAKVDGVTRSGNRAVADMGEAGGNPFALSLRGGDDGKWRVYDEAGFLPAAAAGD